MANSIELEKIIPGDDAQVSADKIYNNDNKVMEFVETVFSEKSKEIDERLEETENSLADHKDEFNNLKAQLYGTIEDVEELVPGGVGKVIAGTVGSTLSYLNQSIFTNKDIAKISLTLPSAGKLAIYSVKNGEKLWEIIADCVAGYNEIVINKTIGENETLTFGGANSTVSVMYSGDKANPIGGGFRYGGYTSNGDLCIGVWTGKIIGSGIGDIGKLDERVTKLESSSLGGETKNLNYPFKDGQKGKNVNLLKNAIKNLSIDNTIYNIVKSGHLVTLSSITKSETYSSIKLYVKMNNIVSLLSQIEYSYAPKGTIKDSSSLFSIEFNWDMIDMGVYNEMFDGYLLDESCFSLDYSKIIEEVIGHTYSTYSLPDLVIGYIDKRSGKLITTSDFLATDYIPVKTGDEIFCFGAVYGNAAIVGFPSQSESSFIVLSASESNALKYSHNFIIPEGINFIRCSTYKSEVPYILTNIHLSDLKLNTGNNSSLNQNISLKGTNVNMTISKLDSEHIKSNWLGLNNDREYWNVPTNGGYFHLIKGELYFTINNNSKKIKFED